MRETPMFLIAAQPCEAQGVKIPADRYAGTEISSLSASHPGGILVIYKLHLMDPRIRDGSVRSAADSLDVTELVQEGIITIEE
jgi:hypothetical protein